MENASKALIIAGAILIAILLISIGVILINSASSSIDSGRSEMSSAAIQAFNAQFTKYAGNRKSYAEVNQLINTVISSNASHSNQVAIKLCRCGGPGSVMDTARFWIGEQNNLQKCDAGHIVPMSELYSSFNNYPNSRFNVELFYVSEYAAYKIQNNKDLNPVARMYYGYYNHKSLIIRLLN